MSPMSSKRRTCQSNQTSARSEAIKAARKRAEEQQQDPDQPQQQQQLQQQQPQQQQQQQQQQQLPRDCNHPKSTCLAKKLSASIADTDADTVPQDPHQHLHQHSHSHSHSHPHTYTHPQRHTHSHMHTHALTHTHVHANANAQDQMVLSADGAEEGDDGCLHCHRTSTEIQVRCDECQAFICTTCHWCHEYQANHEIRVCDRCDAFYCRNCDEMDQCDDCGEVVCASCSTLLSCKFCGGGLCEECATACGRCGIVLCSRDAKFAVDCDTCRLSYCLVCLASGSKDPCVRCGHRPSKRMEQLVHLRLKSIYKAFKQSSKSPKNQMETYYNHEQANESGPTIEELKEGMDEIQPTRRPKEDLVMEVADSTAQTDLLAEQFLEEKQKEADAAAEALLAELEEEEEAAKTKKSKKKKKKERLQKAKKKDDEEIEPTEMEEDSKPPATPTDKQRKQSSEIAAITSSAEKMTPKDKTSPPYRTTVNQAQVPLIIRKETNTSENTQAPKPSPDSQMDPFEKRLCDCVDDSDIDGIEGILFELKGVPGRAALRKNAKKALKRLRAPASAATEEEEEAMQEETVVESTTSKEPIELLKLVSDQNVPGKQPNRAECVMQMSPIVVGWVIGKGGQRIRDLMEESGAKVWIDQEKAKPDEARNVYISGDRRAVDQAVHMVRDIVSKAPIEGAAKYAPEQEQLQEVKHSDHSVENPQEAVARIANHSAVKTPFPLVTGTESILHNTESSKPIAIAPAPGLTLPSPQQFALLNVNEDEDKFEHVMTCEARFVPLLIGKRGWAIKDIQDKSGARVDIDQTVTPRQIRISGPKTCVDKAIPMVRDVLSYPHAQPQPGNELGNDTEQPTRITATTQHDDPKSITGISARTDSPPPYTYIMTGDSKSAISASSSLSSTPEPSTASSSVKGLVVPQLATGTMIPSHDYNLPAISQIHALSPSRGQYIPQDMPRSLNLVGDPSAFAQRQCAAPIMYGGSGLVELQHIPGMGLPPPHPNHDLVYKQAATLGPGPFGHIMMQSHAPPVAYASNDMVSSSSTKFVQESQVDQAFGNLGLPPGHRTRNVGHLSMSQQPRIVPYAPMSSSPLVGGLVHEQGVSAFDGHSESHLGSWNSRQSGREYAHPPGIPRGNRPPPPSSNLGLGPPPLEGFTNSFQAPASSAGGMTLGRVGATVPLGDGFDMGPGRGTSDPAVVPFNSTNNTSGQSLPINSLRDDSRIIDSLFGPPSTAIGGNVAIVNDPSQRLLTGLNTLHLEGAGPSACVSTGGTGIWGSALPDWNSTSGAPKILDPTSNDPDLESSILAGLQPFNIHEDTQQHPPQSRFHWGSTNA